jgi:hypothetical protein
MSDLPPLAPSTFVVTPSSNWQAVWESYTQEVHPSDTWAPEEWNKPLALKEVRGLHHFASQQAVGKGRVIAVPLADQLTRETGNALLKLLEEPPAGVSVILFGETDRMLATVRSRVQVMHPLSDAVSSERLIRFYQELDPVRNPTLVRRFLYYAPLLHNTIQTDAVLDAFQS